jgi:hypothetical protein
MINPDASQADLREMLGPFFGGEEIPDIDSPAQMDAWRAERAFPEAE